MAERDLAVPMRPHPLPRFVATAGWKARGFAAVLGLIAGLGFAPLNLVPAFMAGLVGLIWLTAEAPTRRAAFWIGWWWGFGHFAANSYWIAESFLIDAARFGWMIPFVIGGLSAYLALFPALAVLVLRLAPRPLSFAGIALFAAAWAVAEWLRGHILTGYPWDLAAYIWSGSDAMMQSAALWGSWGLSLATVFVLGLPALLLRRDRRVARNALIALVVAFGVLYGGGAWRLANTVGDTDTMVRIVQPNIAQTLKLSDDGRPQQIDTLMRLTLQTPGFDKVKAVIWPESAADYLLEREPGLVSILAQAAPQGGVLITGAPRGEPASGTLDQIWNSLAVIDHQGRILGTFDKFHLVPLGEYVPLRQIFPFINKLTPGSMNFSAGPGPRTLHLPALPPVSPLICYEAIFPGAVVDPNDRPGLLINITNDGWFGTSTGPFQHFVTARFRAVEEGIPLLRSANTGISGVVDAYGRVETRSSMVVEAVIDAAIPAALPPTPFARFGIWAVVPLLLLALVPMLFERRKPDASETIEAR
jgi:apolipoprotein N-acyltransferase